MATTPTPAAPVRRQAGGARIMLYEQHVATPPGPDTEFPLRCRVTGSGVLECLNNESRGELPPAFAPAYRRPPQVPPQVPFDTPLNRILSRGAVGPWMLVGAAIATAARSGAAASERRLRGRRRDENDGGGDDNDKERRDRTMRVYAQSVDAARDRYNYRVVDSNNVPLEIGENVRWLDDGDALYVPGYGHYRLQLYGRFT